MVIVNFYDDIFGQTSQSKELKAGSSIKDIANQYLVEQNKDYEVKEVYNLETGKTEYKAITIDGYKVITIVNNEEKDLDYITNDNDLITIVFVPQRLNEKAANVMTTLGGFLSSIGGMVAMLPGAGTVIGGVMMGIGAGLVIWGGISSSLNAKNGNDSSDSALESENALSISGGSNQPIVGQRYPYIMGRHLINPRIVGSPYNTTYTDGFSGKDGGQYLTALYCIGYGPLKLSDFKIGDTWLSYNTEKESSAEEDNRYAVIHGLLKKIDGSTNDNGEILRKWKNNDVSLEILQKGSFSKDNKEMYGVLYPEVVKQKEVGANLLNIKDGLIEEVANKVYKGIEVPKGFNSNTVRFSESCPKKIEVELDFPQGLFAQRSKGNDIYYYNLPVRYAVQWRFVRHGQNSSDSSDPYGWNNFDCIELKDGTKIKPKAYSYAKKLFDYNSNLGKTDYYDYNRGYDPITKRKSDISLFYKDDKWIQEGVKLFEFGTENQPSEISKKDYYGVGYKVMDPQPSSINDLIVKGCYIKKDGNYIKPNANELSIKYYGFNYEEDEYETSSGSWEEITQTIYNEFIENYKDTSTESPAELFACKGISGGKLYINQVKTIFYSTETLEETSAYIQRGTDDEPLNQYFALRVEKSLTEYDEDTDIWDEISESEYEYFRTQSNGETKVDRKKGIVVYNINGAEIKAYEVRSVVNSDIKDISEEINSFARTKSILGYAQSAETFKEKYGVHERRYVISKTFTEEECRQLVNFNSENPVSIDSVEVRVLRITPSYFDEEGSRDDDWSNMTYQDLSKWTQIRTFTFDKDKYKKALETATDPSIISVEDYAERPQSAADMDKFCYVALRLKQDAAQTGGSSLKQLSCIAESFAPKYDDKEKCWYPSPEPKFENDENYVKQKYKYFRKDGKDLVPITASEYDPNNKLMIKERNGTNFSDLIKAELFSDGNIKNRDSEPYDKYILPEALINKYITSNTASIFALTLLGPVLGRDSKTYNNINLYSLTKAYEYYEDVVDGTYVDPKKKDELLHIKFTCNGVVDKDVKLEQLLQKILITGRSGLKRDEENKYDIVIGKEVSYPLLLLNQKNCLSRSNTRSFDDTPSGLQVNFVDEADNFNTNDVFIMCDGEDYKNPSKETESYNFQYVTNRHQVYSLGRFNLGCRVFQREVYNRSVGKIGYLLSYGDMVLLQDESLLVGTDKGARIKEIIYDNEITPTKILGFITNELYEYTGEIDEESGLVKKGCTIMQSNKMGNSRCVTLRMAGPDYSVTAHKRTLYANKFRYWKTVNGIKYELSREQYDYEYRINKDLVSKEEIFEDIVYENIIGLTNVILLESPISLDNEQTEAVESDGSVYLYIKPAIDDLIAFGDVDTITMKAIVTSIKPKDKNRFDLTLSAYNEALYHQGDQLIEFKSNMTSPLRNTEEPQFTDKATKEELNNTNAKIQKDTEVKLDAAIFSLKKNITLGEDAAPPLQPTEIQSLAKKDGISISCKITSKESLSESISALSQIVASYRWYLQKGQNKEFELIGETVNNRYDYLFNRDEDGYPEKDELENWNIKVEVVSIYNKVSEPLEAPLNTEGYGTWIPTTVENLTCTANESGLKSNWDYSQQNFYGVIKYKVELLYDNVIKKSTFNDGRVYEYLFNRKVDKYPEKDSIFKELDLEKYTQSTNLGLYELKVTAIDNESGNISTSVKIGVDDTDYNTWIPTAPLLPIAIPDRDDISINWDEASQQSYGTLTYNVSVFRNKELFNAKTNSNYYSYKYDRKIDGYPEKEDFANWEIEITSFNGIYNSEGISASIDTTNYKSWKIPIVELENFYADKDSIGANCFADLSETYGDILYDYKLEYFDEDSGENILVTEKTKVGNSFSYNFDRNIDGYPVTKAQSIALLNSVPVQKCKGRIIENYKISIWTYALQTEKAEIPTIEKQLTANGYGTWIPPAINFSEIIAEENSVNIKLDISSVITDLDYYGSNTRYRIESSKGNSFDEAISIADASYSWHFNRSVDGYPEAEDLDKWRYRVKSISDAGYESISYSPNESGYKVTTDLYGTWKIENPIIETRGESRTVTLLLSQPSISGNKVRYGHTKYKLQVRRYNESTWYKPDSYSNPFPSEELSSPDAAGNYYKYPNENNYKITGYLEKPYIEVERVYSQTMPLEGQGKNALVDTGYEFNVQAFNEANESEWVNVSVTAICTNIRDIVKAKETAKEAYITELSAISANIGTITGGTFQGSTNNFWNLSKYVDDSGEVHYEGEMRVGGVSQYLWVKPSKIDSAGNVTDYEIRFKVGNFEITSTASNINGELIVTESDTSLDRTRITPEGTYYEHRESVYSEWKVVSQMRTDGIKTKSVYSDETLVLSNKDIATRRLEGTDIGRPYLSDNSRVWHFDTDEGENYLDQYAKNDLITVGYNGTAPIRVDKFTEGFEYDFTPAILAVAPYSEIARALFGQFNCSFELEASNKVTVDFWIKYMWSEDQTLVDIGDSFDRIKLTVQSPEPYYNIWDTDNDGQITEGECPWNQESVEVGVGFVCYNTPDTANKSYIEHTGTNNSTRVLLSDRNLSLKDGEWYHIGFVMTADKIALYYQDQAIEFDRYNKTIEPITAILNELKNSFLLDELFIDSTVAEDLETFKEATELRIPWGALNFKDKYLILEAQNKNFISNIFETDSFENKVIEILQKKGVLING